MATRKEQRKFQKKKKKESDTREVLLKRRIDSRAKLKQEKDQLKQIKRIEKLQRDLDKMDQHFSPEQLALVDEKTMQQLEKNVEILKTLELDYEKERSFKTKVNQDLESKGLYTLESKMDFINNALSEGLQEDLLEMSADNGLLLEEPIENI